ncbi:MAG: ATPase domain-containing protein [Bacillota bacterium]|nr:ATPase domain-containing protein [Bacillota bacterium]
MTKIRTGITGFDELFYGGILAGSTILVEGIPGAGKTTFGIEFIYRGAQNFEEPGIVLTFEQFPASLYRDALNFGWDLQALERQNKLRVICTSPEVVLRPELDMLEGAVREIGARRVLVDSMSHFRQVVDNPLELRQAVYAFCNGLRRLNLISLLVKEQEQEERDFYSFEEFLVDVVVRLRYGANGGLQRQRTVEIIKSRGQPHVSGRHSFKIAEEGIQVFSLHPLLPAPEEGSFAGPLLKTGIKGLDELLRGGLPRGVSIAVVGEAGTGKTVLGLEYLVRGALQRQEKGLFVSLEETPQKIQAHAAAFNWDLADLMRKGMVQVIFTPLVEVDFDELLIRVGNIIQEHKIMRVVFDTLPALITRLRDVYVLREKLFYLVTYLNNLGCTTLLLYPGTGAPSEQLDIVQSLVQGSILLKSSLFHNRRLRYLELYKLRGVSHVTGNHLMEITQTGIQVFPRVGGW